MLENEDTTSKDSVSELKSKMADPYLCKEFWLQVVKPVEKAGRLDHIPARKPVTKKDYDIARKQREALSKNNYAFPDNGWYDRIFGDKTA